MPSSDKAALCTVSEVKRLVHIILSLRILRIDYDNNITLPLDISTNHDACMGLRKWLVTQLASDLRGYGFFVS